MILRYFGSQRRVDYLGDQSSGRYLHHRYHTNLRKDCWCWLFVYLHLFMLTVRNDESFFQHGFPTLQLQKGALSRRIRLHEVHSKVRYCHHMYLYLHWYLYLYIMIRRPTWPSATGLTRPPTNPNNLEIRVACVSCQVLEWKTNFQDFVKKKQNNFTEQNHRRKWHIF